MLNKIINVIVAFALSGALLSPAQAVDLGAAFNSITAGVSANVDSPSAFSSQARVGMSGGGVDIRVPRGSGSPQLVSLTPPTVSAGCNGISAHFGGFSFISGQEFGKLLKNVASGAALGFVSSLVMKTLCPVCEQVISNLTNTAREAAKSIRDSCQLGKNLAADFKDSIDRSQMCANIDTANGNSSQDALASYFGVCNKVSDAVDVVRQANGIKANPTDAADFMALQGVYCAMQSGNVTWATLDSFASSTESDTENHARKIMLLNILGAEMGGASDKKVSCELASGTVVFSEDGANKKGTEKPMDYCAPTTDTSVLTGLFLCGAGDLPATGVSQRIQKYCADYFGGAYPGATGTVSPRNVRLWRCGADTAEDRKYCNELVLAPASTVLKGEGFLVHVNKRLLTAVENVRNNVGFDTPEGREIIKLINVAPYPLYQAINAAAVYPAAATDLLDSMSILVAEQMAYALLDDMLKLRGKSTSYSCPMRPAQATKLLDFMAAFRGEAATRKSLMGQSLATQQQLTMQIREINSAISQQVLSVDLLTAGQMSENVNSMVTSSNAGAPK